MRVREAFSLLALAAGLLALAAVSLARADTVTLDNGKTLEGHVIDKGDSIILEMAQGSVKIAKSRVKSISSKVTPQDEFRRRFAEIQSAVVAHELEPAEAAERFFVLAEWAGAQGLARGRAEALKRTLDLNPEHAGAREACGYVLQDGRWLTYAERNKELGLVLYEGQWVPPEAAQEARQAQEAALQKQREAERAAAERRRKNAEAEKLEAERDLAAQRREEARAPWYGYNRHNRGPWSWNGPGIGWSPYLFVEPYSSWQWPYVLVPSAAGRPNNNNTAAPATKPPGPYGPQLRATRPLTADERR